MTDEERLADGLRQAAAAATVPAGLTERARAAGRRRRRRERGLALCSVAAVAILVVVAAALVRPDSGRALPAQSRTPTPSPSSSQPSPTTSPSPSPFVTALPSTASFFDWLSSLPRTTQQPKWPLLMWGHAAISVKGVTYHVPGGGLVRLIAQLPDQRLLVRTHFRTSDTGRSDEWATVGILAPDGTLMPLFKDAHDSLFANAAYDSVHHVIALGHVVDTTKKGSTTPPMFVVDFFDDHGAPLGQRTGVGDGYVQGYVSSGLDVTPDEDSDHPGDVIWPSIHGPAKSLGTELPILPEWGPPQDLGIILTGNACRLLDTRTNTSRAIKCGDGDVQLSPTSTWYVNDVGVARSTSDPAVTVQLYPGGGYNIAAWEDDNTILLKNSIGSTNNYWQVLCTVPSGACVRTADEIGSADPEARPPG
jgi:hypothetical protein